MTVVEVIIAFAVLVVGISSLMDAMVTSKRITDRATNQAKAYEQIQAQLEAIQYVPFQALKDNFKGIAFDVPGLRPGPGAVSCGTITKLSNPTPDAATPSLNNFAVSDLSLPLRFRVRWVDQEGESTVETVYVVANRGQ
jgi:type II secretory pathway pseudopilin PulG